MPPPRIPASPSPGPIYFVIVAIFSLAVGLGAAAWALDLL
jgi:hypothetical protein